jgi:hypothetical protein
MAQELERMKEVDAAVAAARVAAARQLVEEVAASNALLIRRRQEAADAEAAEDARIASYLALKDRHEQVGPPVGPPCASGCGVRAGRGGGG